jgi:hypothetical protein
LEGLSFCQHKLSNQSRTELTKSIHALKGSWRISQSASTHFVVVSPDFFKQDNTSFENSEVVEPEIKELLRATLESAIYDTQNPGKLQNHSNQLTDAT